MKNKSSDEFTAHPSKYPQGYFKDKPCRVCGTLFKPLAPSHLHCSDECAQRSLATRYLMRTYGITMDKYEEMLEKQNHKCGICEGEGFVMDASKHKLKLVVDHCHKTGKIRGLLCHNCNRGLGLFKGKLDVIESAIAYLEGATTIPQGSTLKRVEAHDTER